MENYIGLDVHATSCTAAIINAQGRRLGSHVIETNGAALVEFLKGRPGRSTSASRKAIQNWSEFQLHCRRDVSDVAHKVFYVAFRARNPLDGLVSCFVRARE